MPVRIVGVDAESEMRGYLHVGDIIVRLGDIEVTSPQVLRDLLHDWPSSGSLRLTVIRDHHTITVTAPLPEGRALGLDLAHTPDRRASEADRRGSSPERQGSATSTAAAGQAPVSAMVEATTAATDAASSLRKGGGAVAIALVAVGAVLAIVGLLGTCPDGSSSCSSSFKGLNIAFVVQGLAIALVGGWLYLGARALAARLRLAAVVAAPPPPADVAPTAEPDEQPES